MAIRYSLKAVFVFSTLVACACFAYFGFNWCLGPLASRGAIAQLKAGTPAQEVERILGPPTDRPEAECWVYERAFNPGWLTVTFDSRGLLVGYDHEPVFP